MSSRAPFLLVALVLLLVAGAWMLVSTRGPAGGAAAVVPADVGEPSEQRAAPATASAAEPERRVQERAPAAEPARARAETRAKEAPDARPEGPLLRGRVLDDRGLPIAGAAVRARAEESAGGLQIPFGGGSKGEEAISAPDGGFEIPRGGFGGGPLALSVRARGFLPLELSRTPDRAEGDASLGDLELAPGVVIEGVVLSADGAPVAGADVRRNDEERSGFFAELAELSARSSVTTDDAGRFTLPHEVPGDYVLSVRHDDHREGRFTGATPPAGGELTGLALRLPPSAAIVGRVDGFPAGREHVEVVALPADEETVESPFAALLEFTGGGAPDAQVRGDGAFELRGLEPSRRYRVMARARAGFLGQEACSDEAVAVAGGEPVVLTWDPGARVVLALRSAATGAAPAEARVRYQWVGGEQPFGEMAREAEAADGRVVLSELRPDPAPGLLALSVHAPGHLAKTLEAVSVPASGELDLGVVTLDAAPRLVVRVVDAGDGEPLRGARVTLRCGDRGGEDDLALGDEEEPAERPFALGAPPARGRTDREGLVALDACGAPTGTLVITKTRYARLAFEVALPLRGEAEVLARLSRGGAIEALVVDSAGAPVAGAEVTARAADGRNLSRKTDAQGRAQLEPLSAGRYVVRAERPSAAGIVTVRVDRDEEEARAEQPDAAERAVELVDGATREVRLELPALASVSGVVLERGEPLAGALVRFSAGIETGGSEEMDALVEEQLGALAGGGASARTDARGRFELEELPAGRHRLAVKAGPGALEQRFEVELVQGENRVELALTGGRVLGRVVDSAGRPVVGARVEARRLTEDAPGEAEEAQQLAAALSLFGGASERGATTGGDGRFELRGLPAGARFVVEARARGYAPASSAPLELAEGEEERGLELVLRAGGSLRVSFEGGEGGFTVVTATSVETGERAPLVRMAMASGGAARFTDLRPGPWRLELDGFETLVVEVRGGEEAQATLRPE